MLAFEFQSKTKLVTAKETAIIEGNIDASLVEANFNEEESGAKLTLTPFQGSATIINLVFATGPFTYPQGFVQLGPVLSLFLLGMTCLISYISATFLIEAISVANIKKRLEVEDSMNSSNVESEMGSDVDLNMTVISAITSRGETNSPFFITEKVEIGTIAERLTTPRIKNVLMIFMMTYMYGAICLKYVSGAESLDAGISYTIWKDPEGL